MKERMRYDHKTQKNTAEALVEARAKLSSTQKELLVWQDHVNSGRHLGCKRTAIQGKSWRC